MPLMLARRGRCIFRQLNLRETVPLSARVSLVPGHVRRVSLAANGRSLLRGATVGSFRSVLSQIRVHSYATAGRPKAHTGRAKATKGSDGAKNDDAKKDDAKNSTSGKKKAGRPAKPKPTLTPEEKEARKEARKNTAVKEEIRQLKKAALDPPKKLPESKFSVAFSEKLKSADYSNLSERRSDIFRKKVQEVKDLPPHEIERYAQIAESNKAANSAAYDAWVKSYTPLQIREANKARKRLAHLQASKATILIRDERLVKRPVTPFLLFYAERFDSGDFKHMAAADAAARVGEEWKGLTESEKQRFYEQRDADVERFQREYREVYGEEPPKGKRRGESESTEGV